MPQDTFTDYVELDKNAKMAPVTATEPIMTNFPNENKDMAVISASKQHQQQIFNEQQQQQLQNNQTQQQEQELQPPQVRWKLNSSRDALKFHLLLNIPLNMDSAPNLDQEHPQPIALSQSPSLTQGF